MIEQNTSPLLTQDGKEVLFDVPFWSVCVENHSINIGTRQERELYKPMKTTVHFGAGINLFGLVLFSEEAAALKWCSENKPSK